jgi:photosystem II stability/assembly factor-like uncharacterized protein
VVVGHTQPFVAPPPPAAVAFFTPSQGLLAFRDGHVLRTRDGGRTWRRERAPRLSALDVVAPTVAFAVAGRSLLRTDDAARSWRRVSPVLRGSPVDFADVRNGWVGLRATRDGGRTWRRIRSPCDGYDDEHLALATARVGFVVCGGQPATIMQDKLLYRTADSGRTWRLVANARMFGAPKLRGILPSEGYADVMTFRDPRHGVLAAGRIGLYTTTDGGLRWQTGLVMVDGPAITAVAWPTRRALYVLLTNGELVRRDARRRWRLVYPHTLPPPNVFAFADVRHGIGAGRSDFRYDPGAILATADGGHTWHERGRIPGVAGVTRVVAASRRVVYALTWPRSRVFRSADGGRSWRLARRTIGLARGARVGRHVWRVKTHPCAHPRPNCPGVILRSSDGGRSWIRIRLDMVPGTTLDFVSPRIGYAKDPWTPLYRTRDGGRTWRVVS